MANPYRGRIAPTPTGYLHLGHAQTFRTAHDRARAAGGALVFRMEDLDLPRCRPEFVDAALQDLAALGLTWDEGPDVGGPHAPYHQSGCGGFYLEAWQRLREGGWIYPCHRSRKDVATATQAPHEENIEPVFPPEWRPQPGTGREARSPDGTNWRFRVPDGEVVGFEDRRLGLYEKTAAQDFGDFLVWRRDGIPAYELAVVVDDARMQITEVVRGEDLMLSTCRQLLLYRALKIQPPAFYHAPLLMDEHGRRLAKRSGAQRLGAARDSEI